MTPLPWHRESLQSLAADRARLPHALLVQGAAGTGKGLFARALAASVLCEAPREGLACNGCESCHWFSQGNHPDFREVVPEAAAEDDESAEADAKPDKAKSLVIKIDQVRAIGDFISLSTHRAGLRVLILRPAESMQPAAANSLLKTLEEPPPGTLIVLVSDRPARLLPTIRSRCRVFTLPMPAREVALAWLREQGVPDPGPALALAGGAPLLAAQLTEPEEEALRRKLLAELSRPSGADPLSFAPSVDRASIERTIHWMQTWVMDLARVKAQGEPRHHGADIAALRAKAKGARMEALLDLDRELTGARALAAHPLNARLMAEHLLLSYNRATQPESR